jgi:Fic family protein
VQRGPTGEWVPISTTGAPARAFVPRPLPPDPPLEIGGELRGALDRALLALGRLDSVSALLPETSLFLYAYVRKEAVLSSQIEGTQSSLSDLLFFELDEAPGVPRGDVEEVSRYVAALEHGLRRLREGFPLSNRLLREIHAVLLAGGRGAEKQAGAFRHSQSWIGGASPVDAVYVPPPPERVEACMGALEGFLHAHAEPGGVLVKTGLAHVQFETIHPFLDGNGRLGRLLVTLLLCAEGVLREPLLYLSLFLKARRSEYYERLQRTRTDGDWEGWLGFFAEGVVQTAEGAVTTARGLVDLFARYRTRIRGAVRAPGSALAVHDALQRRPVLSVARAAELTGLSVPTVTAALRALEPLGIVRELTGKKRGRLYGYADYLAVIEAGTERATG